MIISERVRERMAVAGLNLSQLGRAVGMTQGAISKIASNNPNGSSKLHLIARVLLTTPAYLTGETDDPEEGAPALPPMPRIQMVMMPVSLPSEAALAEMYEGQLRGLARLEGVELARALAKRLPRALARLQAAGLYEETEDAVDEDGVAPLPDEDRRAARRAQRR